MAKKTVVKTKTARKTVAKSTNRSVAAPTYSETRRAKNINATKARLILDNSADAMQSVGDHVNQFFVGVAKKFDANPGYGLQHFNQDGFVHPTGVMRLSNESLALLAVQISEVLSQRAANVGNESFAKQMGEGGDPQVAKKSIEMIRRFLNERPAQIKSEQKLSIYAHVMNDLGIADVSEIVPKAKEPKAEPKAEVKAETEPKAKPKGKSRSKKPAAKAQAQTETTETAETVSEVIEAVE